MSEPVDKRLSMSYLLTDLNQPLSPRSSNCPNKRQTTRELAVNELLYKNPYGILKLEVERNGHVQYLEYVAIEGSTLSPSDMLRELTDGKKKRPD